MVLLYNGRFLLVLRECSDTGQFAGFCLMLAWLYAVVACTPSVRLPSHLKEGDTKILLSPDAVMEGCRLRL
jgi:hypothetical protein